MGKVFYVLRGLQGTGKSTVAHEIVSESGTQNTLIASSDDYFMVDGEYIFNPEKLGEYHQANYNRCVQFFENMETADDAVCILDNTNVEHWHYEPYVEKAEQYGFEVRIVVISWRWADIPTYARRNKHGVSEIAIRNTARKWEA